MIERAAGDAGNHLHSVGQILFDGAETEAQHLTVIERGLGESPSPEEWTAVLDYAREHLDEGPLIDVHLTVAERIVGVPSPTAADQKSKRPAYQSEDYAANAVAVAQVVNTLDALARSPIRLEDGTYERMLTLVDAVQNAHRIDSYFDVTKAVAGIGPQPGEQMRGRWARAAGSLIDGATEKIDNPKRSFWAAASRSLENERMVTYEGRISGLAVRIIDRVVAEADDPAEVLGQEPYDAYLDQAAKLNNAYHGRDYEDGQGQVDAIVDKAVRHIGVDSPGAVKALLALHGDVYLDYSRRESMLDRAIEITKASSREPRMSYTRSRFFGLVRFREKPSQFEERRSLLEAHLSKNFASYLEDRPAVISEIFGLYHPAEDDDIRRITDDYAQKLVNRAFTNGHYDPQAISGFPAEMARLRGIIPAQMQIAEKAEELVRQRLAQSTPIGSAAESD